MTYQPLLSDVWKMAVSASNQAFSGSGSGGTFQSSGVLTIDGTNAALLKTNAVWSTLSPSYRYYPSKAMAIDGTNIDTASSVELDTSNNIYVSGTYNVSAPTIYNSNASSSGLVLPANSNSGAYAVKYSSTGVASWAVAVDGVGNETSNSIAVDTSGYVVLAGSYDTVAPTIYNAGNIASTSSVAFPSPTGNTSAYIVKYDSTGTAVWNTVIDSAGADGINSVATDASNNVIVGGSYVPVSAPVNIPQVVVSTLASGLGNLQGVAVDSVGNAYVADYGNHSIRKITSAGVVTIFAGSGVASYRDGTGTNAGFNSPWGITVDSSGNVYVADTSNNRIRKITNVGVVTTFAGSGTGTSLDGTGTSAGFNTPSGICIDLVGNIYVSDLSGHRIRKITSAGVVTTLAGSGTASYGNGTGTNSGFNTPYGVAIDYVGNIYVGDQGNQRIRKITSDGVVTTLAGSGTATYLDGIGTNAGFKVPSGVAVDSAGNVYVADYSNQRIRKITSAGVVSTIAGSGTATYLDSTGTNAGFYAPYGIAVDISGNVYVSEWNNKSVRKLTQTVLNVADQTTVTTIAGSGTATWLDGTGTNAGLNNPRGITIDSAGNLYVADYLNNRIRKITSGGVVSILAGSGAQSFSDATGTNAGFNQPFGIGIDTSGNVYVADTFNHRIRKITSGGVVSTFAGSGSQSYGDGTGTNSGFNLPTGVTVDSAGTVYVADMNNQRIRKITSAGVVTTLAGSGTASYGDGTGTSTGFNNPNSIVVDYVGNLYIADYSNHRIRKVTSAGVVSTLAGSGTATWLDGTGTNAGFNQPYGIAIDLVGNVYVGDQTNNRIRKITSAGVVTTLVGSGTATYVEGIGTNASFNTPTGITVDLSGNLYVSDMTNNRIRKITGPIIAPTIYDYTTVSGTSTTTVGYPLSVINEVRTIAGSGTGTWLDGIGTNAGFKSSYAVAIDQSGNIYVCDYSDNRIRKITSAGVVTTLAGSGTASYLDGTGTNASFKNPYTLTVDSVGNVYVADTGNYRIRKITSAGVVTTFAGSGTATYLDSTGTNAGFSSPYGVAIDSAGNLYVSDGGRIRKITSAGVVTTLAGSGAVSYGDGTGTNSGFNFPVGVAVDFAGNIYVAEYTNNRIRKITSTGVVTTLAGSGTGTFADGTGINASFKAPNGVAVDYAGNVYVADYQNNRIRKITSTGTVTTLAGSVTSAFTFADGVGSNAGFSAPLGIAVDSVGNLYIADTANVRVRRLETLGVGVSVLAGSGTSTYLDGIGVNAGFNNIWQVAVDSAGNLYIVDSQNNRIRKITSGGLVTTLAGSGTATYLDGTGTNAGFYNPRGVTVDSVGNVYVGDTYNHRIRKITSAGVVTTFAGGGSGNGTGTNASFYYPGGLAIDSNGNLYVADNNNNSIRKITSAGVVTTLAGSGTPTLLDGIGTNASFQYPSAVSVDIIGNVYVADRGNNLIRKITSSGVVTTFASGFNQPYGITVDSTGNVYVADTNNSYIRKITPSQVVSTIANISSNGLTVDTLGNLYVGTANQIQKISAPVTVSTFAGSGTASYGDGIGVNVGFNGPNGMNIDSSNNLYVADYGNNRLRKITPTGVVTTLAGSGTGTWLDGTGSNAGFNGIMETAVDSAGNVYVGDTQNNRIRKVTSAGVVTTLAGSGTASYGDGTGTNSGFNNPYGVAVDSLGNVYVADFNNHRIRKIDNNGVVTTFAGSGTATWFDSTGTNAGFYRPIGTTIDSIGNIYVTEYGNNRIRKITSAGVVTTLAGGGSGDGIGTNAGFSSPFGATVDLAGNVYVLDSGSNSIRKITSAGVVTTLAGSGAVSYGDGTGTNAGFNSPRGIAVDSSGNLYIGDTMNNRIRKISVPYTTSYTTTTTNSIIASPTVTLATGGVSNTAALVVKYNSSGVSQWSAVLDGTATDSVSSVTTDSSGNVYMSGVYGASQPTIYGQSSNVWVVSTLAGSGTATWLDGTGTNAGFSDPSGMAVDSSGNVYVGDLTYNRIRKITSTGVVTTLAGGGSGNGTGTNAGFNGPFSLAVDTSGNVYVAEANNNSIRKITSGGVVTTLASGLSTPIGVAVDSVGNLYVSCWNGNTIAKITSGGTVSTLAGGSSGTTGTFADGTGTNAGFYYPFGVAVDSAGNVYITDQGNNRIRKITSAGVVTTLASGISDCVSVAVDSSGNLYILERTANRIRKLTSGGVVSTFAGSGTATWLDGIGTNAGFNAPQGIAIDSAGTLYIADKTNNRIRKITAQNTLTAGVLTSTISTTGNAAFGLKLDSTGNAQWIVGADGISSDQALGCATDGSGNFYLAGSYGNNSARIYNANNTTSSLSLPAASNVSAFVIKYNSAGNALWTGQVLCDSNSQVAVNSVVTDAYNNVYVAGSYEGLTEPIIYGSNNTINTNVHLPYPTGNTGSNTASFVVKYDSNGTPQSACAIMGSANSSSYGIATDTYGSNMVVTGALTGSTSIYDGNSSVSTIAFPSGITSQAGYVVHYALNQTTSYSLASSLGVGDNGTQKYVSNTGNVTATLNVTSSNNGSVLSTYTLPPNSNNSLFNWYNGKWYKFI